MLRNLWQIHLMICYLSLLRLCCVCVRDDRLNTTWNNIRRT